LKTYIFQRNADLNTVDVVDQDGVLRFRWPLAGNYDRRFTTHLMTKFIGRSAAYNILSSFESVSIAFPHDLSATVAVYSPPEYHEIKAESLWGRIKNFFKPKKEKHHART